MDEEPFPVRGGVLVAVAGPSGAGKDTLIDHARRHFSTRPAEVHFVRRLITRQADAASEDHDTLSPDAFERGIRDGAFACWWEANGLRYALPADTDDIVRRGGVAVANVSRAAIAPLAIRYRNVLSVIVTADEVVLAQRLAARGREDIAAIRDRLARNSAYADARTVAGERLLIDNSGTPEEGGRRMVAAIEKALAWSAVSDTV